MRDKIAITTEMFGATCIAVGLYLWSPALALLWVGTICIVIAWSIGKETNDGRDADSEGN
jgi:hypothetical protein